MPKDQCTCFPCTQPGNGGPVPGHCAACCGRTGIVEYDPECSVSEHRMWAARQFSFPQVWLGDYA